MKKIYLTLAALTLLMLCACAPKTEAEVPAIEPAVSAEEPVSQPETVSMEAVPRKTGVQEENGAYYYFLSDGSAAQETGLQVLDGKTYYLNEDHSLHRFSPGLNDCEGFFFVHDGEEGFVFSPHEAGLLELDGALYDVQPDGSVLRDAQDGVLYFGADGRYTSGSAELDEKIETFLNDNCGEAASREEALRQSFDAIRDNFRYLSMQHYDAGTTDWAEEATLTFLEQGKGNCYCFAGLFLYCARRLGYQATVVAGWESKPTNDHAWVMIEQDGRSLLYDPQLEYAYLYMFGRDPVDMFAAEGENGNYRGFQYYFPESQEVS